MNAATPRTTPNIPIFFNLPKKAGLIEHELSLLTLTCKIKASKAKTPDTKPHTAA